MNTEKRECIRSVDRAGCFSYRGTIYQLDEIWGCKAKIVASGNCGAVVQNQQDDKFYLARPFKPRPYGGFQRYPQTELVDLKDVIREQS